MKYMSLRLFSYALSSAVILTPSVWGVPEGLEEESGTFIPPKKTILPSVDPEKPVPSSSSSPTSSPLNETLEDREELSNMLIAVKYEQSEIWRALIYQDIGKIYQKQHSWQLAQEFFTKALADFDVSRVKYIHKNFFHTVADVQYRLGVVIHQLASDGLGGNEVTTVDVILAKEAQKYLLLALSRKLLNQEEEIDCHNRLASCARSLSLCPGKDSKRYVSIAFHHQLQHARLLCLHTPTQSDRSIKIRASMLPELSQNDRLNAMAHASELMKKKSYREALSVYEDIFSHITSSTSFLSEVYSMMGVTLFSLDEFALSIEAFQRSCTFENKYCFFEAYAYRGHAYAKLEKFREAADALMLALSKIDDVIKKATLMHSAAVYYQRGGLTNDARASFRIAQDLQPLEYTSFESQVVEHLRQEEMAKQRELSQSITRLHNSIAAETDPEKTYRLCRELLEMLNDSSLEESDRAKVITEIGIGQVKVADRYMKQRKPDYVKAKEALDLIFKDDRFEKVRAKSLSTYAEICSKLAEPLLKSKNYQEVVNMLAVFSESPSKDRTVQKCQKQLGEAKKHIPSSSEKKKPKEKKSPVKPLSQESSLEKGILGDKEHQVDLSFEGFSESTRSKQSSADGFSESSSEGPSSSYESEKKVQERKQKAKGALVSPQSVLGSMHEGVQAYIARRAQALLDWRTRVANERLRQQTRLIQGRESEEREARPQLTRSTSKRILSVNQFTVLVEDNDLQKYLKDLEDSTNTSDEAVYWRELKAHLERTPSATDRGFNIHMRNDGFHSADWNVGDGKQSGRGGRRLLFRINGGNPKTGEKGRVTVIKILDPH